MPTNSETKFRVRPTFPLDRSLISGYRRRKIMRSPLTWLALVGAAGASIFSRSMPGLIASFGAASTALWMFWQSRTDALEAEAIQQIITDSNKTQDEELQRIMQALQAKGQHQYAASLGKFLLLKQRIESRLHESGEITKKTQEIEVLVDSLCSSVCDQITQLTALNQKLGPVLTSNRPERLSRMHDQIGKCHERIMKAYGVLFQTARNIDALISPSRQRNEEQKHDADVMDRLIQQLQEENEVAQAVQQRMKELEL